MLPLFTESCTVYSGDQHRRWQGTTVQALIHLDDTSCTSLNITEQEASADNQQGRRKQIHTCTCTAILATPIQWPHPLVNNNYSTKTQLSIIVITVHAQCTGTMKIKHIRAKPSALSQHRSQLLARVLLSTRARARGSRNAAHARSVFMLYVLIACSRPRPAPLGAGRGRSMKI